MNDAAVRRADDDPPVHPPGGDPDAESLAGYSVEVGDGGVLPDAVTTHLAGCAQCRATLDALVAVRTELRAAAPPMPAAVSRRIAAGLRERAPVPTVALAPGVGRHRAPPRDEFSTAWRRRRLRALSSMAAGVIVLGGGGYLLMTGAESIVDAGGDTESADGGGGDAGVFSAEENTAGLPAYDRASLRAAAGDLVGSSSRAEGGVATATPGGLPQPNAAAVEPDCLASLPVATGATLSISRARYEGQPAIIVLFAGAAGRVQVTVLSDCSTGQPMVLDEFEADR